MKTYRLFCAVVVLFTSFSFAANPESHQQSVSLTIYNDNFAVVRESRTLSFEKGVNTVEFKDVASAIDPTTVNFKCLSSPDTVSILEQNYEYDLVNSDALMKRYIDKTVTLNIKGSGADTGREITGLLLASPDNDLIIKTESGRIEILSKTSVEQISLLPPTGDLITRPTLVWLADAKEKALLPCQITYTTGQISWSADYSALLSPDETKLDFTGWVTIDNKCGATFKDASLKLIAGDVRRVQQPRPQFREDYAVIANKAAQPAFEEKAFMEYHMYTLDRKTSVNNNQVKQIEFITPASDVPAKKLFIYDRSQNNDKVQVKIEFENTKENHLGIPLPKGKIRVFKKDPADNTLEFVGEDRIDHTAAKEKLLLYIGNAFDITPKYTLLETSRDRRIEKFKHQIELRNAKKEAVTVFVDENFPAHVNWTIDNSTHEYKKRDADTIRFEVKIPAESSATIVYSVTQTW